MTEVKKPRDPGLDLIRATAAFLVLSVHFFSRIGFYVQPMVGKRMLLMCMMRMGFITCVPLFLLLTGYLCRKKELSRRYYGGIVRILMTYLLCGLVCLGVRACGGETLRLGDVWKELLGYTAAPYGWYIEMYIGLFLLIPFLNLIWKGLEGKRGRLALIGTLLVLVTLPAVTNDLGNILPTVANDLGNVLPGWWAGFYPLLYYFLGAWLGEYQPRPDWKKTVAALLAVTALAGGTAYLIGVYNPAHVFVWGRILDYGGPFVVAEAFLLFLLLRQIPMEKAPGWLRWIVGKCAGLSLGIYLLSWCFDMALYPILTARVPGMLDRLVWFPVMVPAVFLCSALAAQIVEWVRRGLARMMSQFNRSIKRRIT